jgi:hypothetical protein
MILLWTSSRTCRVTLHTAGGFAACARKYVSHYVFPRTCGEAAYICTPAISFTLPWPSKDNCRNATFSTKNRS